MGMKAMRSSASGGLRKPRPVRTYADRGCQCPDPTADADEPPLWAQIGPESMAAVERQAIVAERGRMRASLERHQAALARAEGVIDEQRLELQSLRGRGTAFKLAAAAANKAGSPFNKHDDRRFGALRHSGEEQPTSDDLRELLDLATLATGRRVADTIAAAAAARAESERASADGLDHLDSAFDPNDPARKVARALMVQLGRAATKLRAATLELEQVTSAAQEVNAADARSLVARLSAERQALQHSLLSELSATELEGRNSIRGLHAEISRIEVARSHEIKQRDDELWRRGHAIEQLNEALDAERAARHSEGEAAASRIGSLLSEVTLSPTLALSLSVVDQLALVGGRPAPPARRPRPHLCFARRPSSLTRILCVRQVERLESELHELRARSARDTHNLGVQLATEGADKASRISEYERKLQLAREQHEEMVARYEEQLRTLRREAESEASSLQGNLGELQRQKTLQGEELMATLRTLSAEKEESERSLMEKLKQQEAAAEQEKAMLRSRADRLSRLQDQAIAAGGSTKARAMLYWESMKSKTRLASSISWRGEDEPMPGPEPAAAESC